MFLKLEKLLRIVSCRIKSRNKVFDKTSKSISSVGKSIGDGMALLAAALNTQQPTKIAIAINM